MEPHDPSHGHSHAEHAGCAHDLVARGLLTTRAAFVSVLSNVLLATTKIGTGLGIGSAAVLSEGLHSATDLVASLSAYVSLKIAANPPDETHPYGHGKFEDLSAVFEAGLIVAAALGVVWKAVSDFLAGKGPDHLEYGMGVMVLSIVVNALVSRYLFRMASEHDSLALEADAWHLSADVLTSMGVLVGLALVAITGWKVFDPAAALGVGLFIMGEAYKIGARGLGNLVDSGLPRAEVAAIEEILTRFASPGVRFHALRTRKAGPERHVDVHLVAGPAAAAHDIHDLSHKVEQAIRERFPGARVLVRHELEGHQGACPPEK